MLLITGIIIAAAAVIWWFLNALTAVSNPRDYGPVYPMWPSFAGLALAGVLLLVHFAIP